MPNEYSVEIHAYLAKKIAEAREAIAENNERLSFFKGQLEELLWIRNYMKEHIDLKNYRYY